MAYEREESVAWFALEEGAQLSDYQLDAAKIMVGDSDFNINFTQAFSNVPAFFSNMQSNTRFRSSLSTAY